MSFGMFDHFAVPPVEVAARRWGLPSISQHTLVKRLSETTGLMLRSVWLDWMETPNEDHLQS